MGKISSLDRFQLSRRDKPSVDGETGELEPGVGEARTAEDIETAELCRLIGLPDIFLPV